MKKIKINKSKIIFNYSEPYIIAEIGANHNGDIELAKKLIDAAKECGADAAKFQSWTPQSILSKIEYKNNQTYNDGDGGKKHFGSLKEMVKKYYLSESEHLELKQYCEIIDIDFCSSPFSNEEVDMLNALDVPFFKVASMDINNFELLKHVANYNKPVLLSTGMSTLEEIIDAVNVIEKQGNNQIIILHCISIYPPKYKDINLNNIKMLQETFDYPIGFSDHSIGTSIPLSSVSLGACVIEKHFTLDKDLPGWDHEISANPSELKEIVRESKNIQKSLGSFSRIISKDEEDKKKKFRRSIITAKKLNTDHILTLEDVCHKRPGTGIPPNKLDKILGKKIVNDIEEDVVLNWEDLK